MSELTVKSDASRAEVGRVVLRCLCFTAGLLVNSFGVALITKATLGTSPISSIPYVLDLRFAPTFGQFTFVLNMAYIAAQAALLRRDFRPVQLLQVVANVIFSAFIDVSMGLLWWLSPAGRSRRGRLSRARLRRPCLRHLRRGGAKRDRGSWGGHRARDLLHAGQALRNLQALL